MSATFAEFIDASQTLSPRTLIVLGSGLTAATHPFREHLALPFRELPDLVPPTVHGHSGLLALGHWGETPLLVCSGRLHFYEGHPWQVVTRTIRIAAELGVKRIVLTNAAGGIHESLTPGSLLALRGHLKWLGPEDWRHAEIESPYSLPMLERLLEHEKSAGRELLSGTYAALTGPSYETPAEIRALRVCGADAVGMSTAREAEAAVELGLEVAAISCITNKAAGLSSEPLDHREVLGNAKLAVSRLGELLDVLVNQF